MERLRWNLGPEGVRTLSCGAGDLGWDYLRPSDRNGGVRGPP